MPYLTKLGTIFKASLLEGESYLLNKGSNFFKSGEYQETMKIRFVALENPLLKNQCYQKCKYLHKSFDA